MTGLVRVAVPELDEQLRRFSRRSPGEHRATTEAQPAARTFPRMPQGPELVIVLFVIILLFGGAKLPKLARSLGRAQTEFKQGLHEGADADDAGRAATA